MDSSPKGVFESRVPAGACVGGGGGGECVRACLCLRACVRVCVCVCVCGGVHGGGGGGGKITNRTAVFKIIQISNYDLRPILWERVTYSILSYNLKPFSFRP